VFASKQSFSQWRLRARIYCYERAYDKRRATARHGVRVAEAVAGPNWGSQFTPRLSAEVLVDFLDGDMDQPVIVGQLYNGVDTPPFAAGVDSGINHGGTISGWHSVNHSAGGGGGSAGGGSGSGASSGYNQWVLDDTRGQRANVWWDSTQLDHSFNR
jgi:uncharacterized protein involved in type VI secretion and phage assembly